MRGDYHCELCKSNELEVIYVRHSLKLERPISLQSQNDTKRKQAFVRIGVKCKLCGSVFLDSSNYKEWRIYQKERRKNGTKIPRNTPQVKEFVPYVWNWRAGKYVKEK